MNKNVKILAILSILMLNLSLFADEKYLDVESFDGIEIGTGMRGTVTCGSKNSVTLIGDQRDLDRIEVTVHGGLLDISRRSTAKRIFSNIFGEERNHSIAVEVTISGNLSNIEGSTGSSLTVPECAVDSRYLTVDISTGAEVYIDGKTTTLNLDLSTGAIFNNSRSSFTVEMANVDLSTGAVATLCGADIIDGDASTGAVIRASESANTNRVSLSLGANVSSRKCR